MDRRRHTTEAQRRFASILQAVNTGDLNGAGEFIWATIIHAVSAADPEHETNGSDRFGNLHRAPSYAETYRQAVARIPAEARKEIDFATCLDIAQRSVENPRLPQRTAVRQSAGRRRKPQPVQPRTAAHRTAVQMPLRSSQYALLTGKSLQHSATPASNPKPTTQWV